MSHGFRRMPLAAKVSVLEREVGCDEDLVSPRHVEYGAIVADGVTRFFVARGGGAANALDEFEFGQEHIPLGVGPVKYIHIYSHITKRT